MENNELYHFGVKGMKWGVRRAKKQTSGAKTGRKSKQDNWSEEAKTVAGLKKKKVNEMSNAELRKYNERVQLEQQYARLNPGAVKKGMKFIAGAAGVMGTAMNLYNNSDKMLTLGRKVSNRVLDFAGDMVMRDLKKHW